LKRARPHLDARLASAPNDTDTLLIAVQTALAGDSHKKAAGFAKRLLELDPINPRQACGSGGQGAGRGPALAGP